MSDARCRNLYACLSAATQSLTMPQRPAAVGLTAVPHLLFELFLGVVTVVDGLDRGLVGRDVHGGGELHAEDDGA